jgi:hypothetical protein
LLFFFVHVTSPFWGLLSFKVAVLMRFFNTGS